MTYQEHRKSYLACYKKTFLTDKNGNWRNKTYEHILPIDLRELNILENIRGEFWKYFKPSNIKLHQNFCHLNSSQALCFNLFFPLFNSDNRFLTYILHRIIEVNPVFSTSQVDLEKLFSIQDKLMAERFAKELDIKFIEQNKIMDCQFEMILDSKEETNFDFYVALQNNYKVLFEIKYTETEFGKAKKNKGHIQKYDTIYKDKLSRVLKQKYNNLDFVLDNYQIVRNLSYIDDLTSIVFILPENNTSLHNTKDIVNEILLEEKLSQVRIVYLENFIRLLVDNNYLHQLRPVFEAFKLKYCS